MKIHPDKLRIIQTFNMNLCFFCLGLIYSAFGTTLLDLAEIFNTTTELISYTITTRAVGSLIGGLIGGFVYKFVNGQILAVLCSLFCGVGTLLTPLVPSVLFVHVISFIVGASVSFIEIGYHVWAQVIWKERSGPQFQLFNVIYGLGGILAPFICEPFLSKRVQRVETFASPNLTTGIESISTVAEHSQSVVHIAYWILGGAFILSGVLFLVSYSIDKTDPKPSKEVTHSQNSLPNSQQYIVVALAAAYQSIGVACEIGLATYIPTFVVLNENLHFDKSSAAFLSSVYWASFTASRVVATFLTFKLSPAKLISFFTLIVLLSQVFVSCFINYSPWVAWIGFAVLAFGLSPYYGNATVWSVQYIQLTHQFMAVAVVSTCASATLPSLIIGRYIDNWPMIMVHGHAVFVGLLTLLVLAMIVYGRTPLLRHRASVAKNG